MNASENPFESPAEPPQQPDHLRWPDMLAVAVWLMLPIGVFLLHRFTAPLFEDFGTKTAALTKLISNQSSVVVLAAIAALVTIAVVKARNQKTRRVTTSVALSLGTIVTLAIAVAFGLPLLSLVIDLT